MGNASPSTQHQSTGLVNLRILARLTHSPATGEQLQRECQAQDLDRSIQELQQRGHNIATHRMHRVALDGRITQVGLYVLKVSQTQRAALLAGA